MIRDEVWIVRSVREASLGGSAVKVAGVSELVRGREKTFLSALDTIQELKPEETKLVADDSPRYRRSRLYLESLLRRTPPTDDAAIDVLECPHCGARRKLIALISDGVVVRKILDHLGLPSEPPILARARVSEELNFDAS